MKKVKNISVIENNIKFIVYFCSPFGKYVFESTEHLLNFSFFRNWGIWEVIILYWFSLKTICFELFSKRITLKLHWCNNFNVDNQTMVECVNSFFNDSILFFNQILIFDLSLLKWGKSYWDRIRLLVNFVCIHAVLFIILRERQKLRISLI